MCAAVAVAAVGIGAAQGTASVQEVAEPPRDWGGGLSAGPRAAYDADLGLLLGGQAMRTD
jgi:hypothetical protein